MNPVVIVFALSKCLENKIPKEKKNSAYHSLFAFQSLWLEHSSRKRQRPMPCTRRNRWLENLSIQLLFFQVGTTKKATILAEPPLRLFLSLWLPLGYSMRCKFLTIWLLHYLTRVNCCKTLANGPNRGGHIGTRRSWLASIYIIYCEASIPSISSSPNSANLTDPLKKIRPDRSASFTKILF